MLGGEAGEERASREGTIRRRTEPEEPRRASAGAWSRGTLWMRWRAIIAADLRPTALAPAIKPPRSLADVNDTVE